MATLPPMSPVRTALPYRYISELRQILCPQPEGHFHDWTWAHSNLYGERKPQAGFGDWIPVYYDQIDRDDPDCVWRHRVAPEYAQHLPEIGKKRKVVELWSPVRAMVLYIKLELPLRTLQVRLLDSGEMDTWRYIQGKWDKNSTPLAKGTTTRAWQRGVFRRMVTGTDDMQVGLYVNTNKTADIGKDVHDRGYVIPWRHERVLYWLEKLRNWQEKYNPVEKPTMWSALKPKHLGDVKAGTYLERMGSACFLFREASAGRASETDKPIPNEQVTLL